MSALRYGRRERHDAVVAFVGRFSRSLCSNTLGSRCAWRGRAVAGSLCDGGVERHVAIVLRPDPAVPKVVAPGPLVGVVSATLAQPDLSACSPELAATSDAKHQSAPEQLGHQVDHSTRRVRGWDGAEYVREMATNDGDVTDPVRSSSFCRSGIPACRRRSSRPPSPAACPSGR